MASLLQRLTQKKKKRPATPPLHTKPGVRGITGRGGGSMPYIESADEFVGSSVQACGLYPFTSGVGAPNIGVPLGKHQITRASVCADPISWFERASLISNPSAVILSKPGLGKSTVADIWSVGLRAYGVLPWFFGDVKGEHVEINEALGGDRIQFGRANAINILDSRAERTAANRLSGQAREHLQAEGHNRRQSMVEALLTIRRQQPIWHREQSVLDVALAVLEERGARDNRVPTLIDLRNILSEAPDELRDAAIDRGSTDRYREITEDMEAALAGIVSGRTFGGTFSGESNVQINPDKPLCFDVSSVKPGETELLAACLVATWSTGFGALNITHALADAGLEKERRYFLILDEVWQALRVGHGMVDHYDALTRLNRTWGTGQVMNVHSFKDFESLPTQQDRDKAKGFMDRAGMLVLGGISQGEVDTLQQVVDLNPREREAITSWATPPSWNMRRSRYDAPPGRGKFLIKSGDSPGIPIDIEAAEPLLRLHDTNQRWQNRLDNPAMES